MAWTRFMDMHSGGDQKEDFDRCYIEAPEHEARSVFYARFGHNPERVTCTCCGADYSIDESETFTQASGYDRNLRFASPISADDWAHHSLEERRAANAVARYLEPGEAVPDGWFVDERFYRGTARAVDDFIGLPNICIIRATDITAEERSAYVPEQGYIWQE